MYDDGYRYSLCLVYSGNRGQNLAYRIADYDPGRGKFTLASYTDKYESYFEFQPTIIGANPLELDFGSACVRKWKPKEDDDTKQISYAYEQAECFEIVMVREVLKAPNKDALINLFEKGIELPWYIKGAFLLAVEDTRDEFKVILCNKKDFLAKGDLYYISQSVTDMIHTTHSFPIFIIDKRDIISNSLLRFTIGNPDIVDRDRSFYAFDTLPESINIFVPRKPGAYSISFLKWYCRRERSRLTITKKEVDRVLELLDLASEAEDQLEDFLMAAPFSKDEIIEELIKSSDIVTDFLKGSEDIEDIIKLILKEDPELYSETLRIVSDKWMSEESALRDAEKKKTQDIIECRVKTEQQASALDITVNELKSEANKAQEKLDTVEQEILQAQLKKEEINEEISLQLRTFEADIIEVAKTAGIFRFLSEGRTTGRTTEENVVKTIKVIRPSFKNTIEETDASELIDYYEDISENYSLWFEEAAEIASFVIACFNQGLGLIVPSSVGLKVATAFSLMYSGEMPLYIEAIGRPEILFDLADTINQNSVRTVFINGLLDDFRETAIGALHRMCPGKNLLFGIGTISSLELMSDDIYNYALPLPLEEKTKIVDEQGVLYSTKDSDMSCVQLEANDLNPNKIYNRYLKGLCRENLLGKGAAKNLAHVIAYYFTTYSSNSLGDLCQTVIKSVCKKTEDAAEQIEKYLSKPKE